MWVYPLPGVRPSSPRGLRRDITPGYHCAAPSELHPCYSKGRVANWKPSSVPKGRRSYSRGALIRASRIKPPESYHLIPILLLSPEGTVESFAGDISFVIFDTMFPEELHKLFFERELLVMLLLATYIGRNLLDA